MLKGISRSRSLVLPLAGSCVKRHRGKQGKNGVKQDHRDQPHGPFLLTCAVLPHMIARHSGVINNTASESSLRGGTGGPVYTTSKHGLVGLARSVAFFHRSDGISANAICPGPVRTNGGGVPPCPGSSRDCATGHYDRSKSTLAPAGIVSEEARQITEASGLTVVMNRCMGATHGLLGLDPDLTPRLVPERAKGGNP